MLQKWKFYTSKELVPAGWLRRQLEIQAEGLSGNLDKVWRDVRDSAWIGGNAEGWERVPYWLDGFIPLAYLLENEDMIARAKKYIDAIIAGQKPSGWLCPCEEKDIPTYDTWAVQLISKVLTVYYDCTGDERIPDVLYRMMKNYYELLSEGEIKLFGWGQYRWFEGLIAINFLYERYREDWLPALAKLLKEQGADYSKLTELWKRPLFKWTFDTHVVNLAMMIKSEAVSHGILGEAYTDQAERLYDTLMTYNGTPAGIFTGDECLAGRSPIQGTELCAVAELMYSFEHLYAQTGDPKWAERLELVAFNALPATISDDMWAHQYDQMSNQISCERFPVKPIFGTNGGEAHIFGLEPNFGCCTANFNQAWPKFALSMFMHSEENGNKVLSAVPIPGRLKTANVDLTLETEYPFKNIFTYKVAPGKAFDLYVRIPSFAENLTVNGAPAAKQEMLCFPIEEGKACEIRIAYETAPYFEERPYGLKTAHCGSLVFSLPVKYKKVMLEYETNGVERKYPYCDYEYVGTSEWQYGFSSEQLERIENAVSAIPFSSELPPVTLKAGVKRIDWDYEHGYDTVCAKIPLSRTPLSEEESVLLYPYGCAKLRVTELPETE